MQKYSQQAWMLNIESTLTWIRIFSENIFSIESLDVDAYNSSRTKL